MKKKFFGFGLFLFFLLATSSCKKDESPGPDTELQIALFTLGFTDINNNIGVIVLSISQKGDEMDIDNWVFRYKEKQEANIRAMCYKFNQAIVDQDTEVIKDKTLGGYVERYFSDSSTFLSKSKLSNEELIQAINKKSISLASFQSNNNLFLSLLKTIVPSANATSVEDAIGTVNVLFTALSVAVISTVAITGSIAGVPPLLIGAGVLASSYAISEIFNTTMIKGISKPSMSQVLSTIYNGNKEYSESHHELWTGATKAALDPNYRAENHFNLKEKFEKAVSSIIPDKNTSYVIVIPLKALRNGNTSPYTEFSNYYTFTAKSQRSDGKSFPNDRTGICIGTEKNLTLNNSVKVTPMDYETNYYYHFTDIPARGFILGGTGVGEFRINVRPKVPGTKYYYRSFFYSTFGPNNIAYPLIYTEVDSLIVPPLG
jgi:hypothetical protein